MLLVQPLTDIVSIESVMTDPWIASRLRHDGRKPGYIDHPALTYYGAYWNDTLQGVFMAISLSPWEVEIHAALLKSAIGLSHCFGCRIIEALWQDPDLLRISAPVMDTLPTARNYCLRLGFQLEGYKRDAVRIDGVAHGIYQMGLTRDDRKRTRVPTA